MLSTAVSVASFSVVLAETFGAVMLSTLIPATFIETANTAKRLAKTKADAGETPSDAEFEFHGKERYEAELRAGAQINLVNITAGYSALYETRSNNKVKLHIEFSSVPITISP